MAKIPVEICRGLVPGVTIKLIAKVKADAMLDLITLGTFPPSM